MNKIRKYFNKKILVFFLSPFFLWGCTTSSNEFTCGTPQKGYCASLDEVNQMVDAEKISDKKISSDSTKNHLIWIAPHSDELGYHTAHYLEEPDALF